MDANQEKLQPANESEQSDMINAGEAMQLLSNGKSLKHKHRGALQRLQSRIFIEECQNLKQKDLCALLGFAQPQLNILEKNIDLPVGSGRNLILSTILKAFKNLLDDNNSWLVKKPKMINLPSIKRKSRLPKPKSRSEKSKLAKAEGSVVDRE